MIFPFGKHKGKDLADIPDTYLDWLLGEQWFYGKASNEPLIQEIVRELALRKRSHCQIPDEYDKTLEDL